MTFRNLDLNQKFLRRRILEISHQAHLSHLGSCLSAVDLIDSVFDVKGSDEKFILSNGHAGIALYAVLEKRGLLKEDVLKKLHIHPDRDAELGVDVSTGSLGQGLPIAVGLALANRGKRVFVMISDGECAEGSIWESLRIAEENHLSNLYIIVNANGWGAYSRINLEQLKNRLEAFIGKINLIDGHKQAAINDALTKNSVDLPNLIFARTSSEQFIFLKEQDAHYYVMTDADYEKAMEDLDGK